MEHRLHKFLKAYLTFILIVILSVGGIVNAQTATAPSGSGTSGDPYLIATLDNLYWVTQNSSSWDKHFLQTADIDASSTTGWDGGAGFFPIGNNTNRFGGTYDGDGHTITGLYINRSSTTSIGMFGNTLYAEIKNIGLINVDVTGRSGVGGLVGANFSNISNSYSTGSVSGEYSVGGLLGYINTGFSITNSYSASSVSGNTDVGGLVGSNSYGSTINCYSTGSVNGSNRVGGLVGHNTGTITNSFWDKQASGLNTSDGGTGKTTAEMKTLATFIDAGWDFEVETANGTDNIWDMDNVNQSANNGYPFLSWQNGSATSVLPGDNIAGAINLGDFQVGALNQRKYVSSNTSSFTNQHSTSPGKDAFYKFNIIDNVADPGKIGLSVHTSGAAFNSVIYLLDASGNQVAVDDDSGNNSRLLDFTGTLSEGTYYVVVDGSSAAQAGSFGLTVQVVQRIVESKFSANPQLGCTIPHTVFFTDQSSSPDVWSWKFGDGSTSTAQNPTHNYTSYGTFIVTLEVADTIYGASSTFKDTIVVAQAKADFTASPLFGCGPLSVDFTDASVGAVSWEWNFGNGATSTEKNPSYIYDKPGTYNVTLTIKTTEGCSDTKTRTNYVQVIGPDVNFGIASASNGFPKVVTFADSTTSGAPITGWSWDFGDGETSNQQNPTHEYNAAGIYSVSLTVTDLDGCSRTLTKNNLVNTPPIVSINQASGQKDPTKSSTINYTVVFNESVTGFTTGDVTLSGTAGATTGTVTEIAPNDGTTYNVAVTGMTNDGTVIASIAAGKAFDSVGDANLASTSSDNSVTYDTTVPSITIRVIAIDDIINATEDNNDVTINGTTSGAEDGQTVTVGLNGKTYTDNVNTNTWSVTVPAADAQALAASETVTADVSDVAGNAATHATRNITHDVTAPTIAISTIAGDDIINATEDNSNVIVNGTTSGAEDGQSVTVGLNGKTYNGTVNSNAWSVIVSATEAQALDATETVTADVSDLAGNAAAQASKNIEHDTTVPTVLIGSPSLTTTSNTPVTFNITYMDADNVNLTNSDVTLTTSGTASGSVVVSGGSTGNPTVRIENISGDGTIRISINPGTSSNTAGNTDAGAGPGERFRVDNTVPNGYAISIDQEVINSSNKNSASFSLTGGESGTTYSYVFRNNNSMDSVSATAGLVSETQIINAIDLSSLDDGKIILTLTLTDKNGNTGEAVADSVMKDTKAPSGYAVSFNQDMINISNTGNVSFQMKDAEVTSEYKFIISDSEGNEIADSGIVMSSSQKVNGLNLSSLSDGKISLGVSLTDTAGNDGIAVRDSIMKDTDAPEEFNVRIDQDIINQRNNSNVSFTISRTTSGMLYDYWFVSNAGTDSVKGSGIVDDSTYQVKDIDLISLNDGTVTLNLVLTDTYGNKSSIKTVSVEKDVVPPVVEIGTPDKNYTISDPVTYSITYTGADVIDLTPGDVVLNKTGTANGTISVENGNSNNPIVGISNISGWGTIGISIKASTSVDQAGNKDVGAEMSKVVNVNDVPKISIFENAITYVEGTDSINVAVAALFEDDSPDFEGGLLTAEIKGNKTDNDRLWLDPGNWIVLSEADILYKNVKVGTYNGGVDGVTIRLNSNSNAESVQQIIRNLVYSNFSNSPSGLRRTIDISFDDNDEQTDVVTANVSVDILTVNNPPVFTIPNEYTAEEDAPFTLKLDGIDPEGNVLTYSAEPMDENMEVGSQNDSTYLLSFAENWSGQTAILVSANDGELTTIDTIYIMVKAVNDPPQIVTPLAPLEYNEDEQIVLEYKDLYQYVNDPDNADSTLLFSFDYSGDHFTVTGITDTNITIQPLENWFGIDTVTVIVSDGELSTQALLDFSILSVNDLPEFVSLADTIEACGSESMQLDMWKIVNDVETPDEFLNFEFTSSSDTLTVDYDAETGLLNLSTPASFGGKIELSIKVTDADNGSTDTSTIYSTCVITSLEALDGLVPEDYVLEQNYPNPFNPTTTIRYGLPEESNVKVMIYNLLGQLVTTLTDEVKKAGYYEDVFDAGRLASGIYLVSIYSESTMTQRKYTTVKKMMLIK